MASSSSSSSLLFNDLFTIKEVDRDGKKFDRGTLPRVRFLRAALTPSSPVSRITAHSSNHEMDLTLDVRASRLQTPPHAT